tara:strand:+ start:110 stop:376 length:267 start_codon:yes stop_codon:yes gene_type:complete
LGLHSLIGLTHLDHLTQVSLEHYFILGTLPASLSVTARRLHDRGHSAWWIIGLIVPVLNFIVFYWLVRAAKDTPEALKYKNPYGKLPK